MGEVLKSKYPMIRNKCRDCGKREGDDSDDFIHTFDELVDLSEDEKKACEWFSEKMTGEALPDITFMGHFCSKEEIIHVFVLENLIERLLSRKPVCETCFTRKGKTTDLS
ncbi:MAG TPA: hypothetical protein ENO00_13095 [Deltaproteobacteria bacterium]|nr:hypothetical protein [Deltaproteobacteria bacterium]